MFVCKNTIEVTFAFREFLNSLQLLMLFVICVVLEKYRAQRIVGSRNQ